MALAVTAPFKTKDEPVSARKVVEPPPDCMVKPPVSVFAPVRVRIKPEEVPFEPAPVVVKALPSVMPPESWSCTLVGIPPVVLKVKPTAPVPRALLADATIRPAFAPEP